MLAPPARLNWSGSGSFQRIGEEYLGYLRELASLGPDDRILDIGCGVGRVAVALTRYLSPDGVYRGFDIMRHQIQWCQCHISRWHPNFQFQCSAIYNAL